MMLLLDGRTSTSARADEPLVRDRMAVADLYQLTEIDLAPYDGLYISGMVDQELLWRERDVVARFIDTAKVVVFCGQLLHPWLPGSGTFVPAPVTSHRDYEVRVVSQGGVLAGVDPRDLTFRRGVAGFFARGHNPPPPGAEVLASLAGGQPITWVDRTTTRGTILVHAGSDLLSFAADSTASRLGPQLLDWAEEEARRLSGKVAG